MSYLQELVFGISVSLYQIFTVFKFNNGNRFMRRTNRNPSVSSELQRMDYSRRYFLSARGIFNDIWRFSTRAITLGIQHRNSRRSWIQLRLHLSYRNILTLPYWLLSSLVLSNLAIVHFFNACFEQFGPYLLSCCRLTCQHSAACCHVIWFPGLLIW